MILLTASPTFSTIVAAPLRTDLHAYAILVDDDDRDRLHATTAARAGANALDVRDLLISARSAATTEAKANSHERNDRVALDVDRLTDHRPAVEKTLDFGKRRLQQALYMLHEPPPPSH